MADPQPMNDDAPLPPVGLSPGLPEHLKHTLMDPNLTLNDIKKIDSMLIFAVLTGNMMAGHIRLRTGKLKNS